MKQATKTIILTNDQYEVVLGLLRHQQRKMTYRAAWFNKEPNGLFAAETRRAEATVLGEIALVFEVQGGKPTEKYTNGKKPRLIADRCPTLPEDPESEGDD